MSNEVGARISGAGSYSTTAVWRSRTTLLLTMNGESNQDAVHALTERCRQMCGAPHPPAFVVVIDTTGVTRLVVSPAFMGACRQFLTYLKSQGAGLVVGVSDNGAIRSVASAVGFGAGIRLHITATLDQALVFADREATRVA